MSKTKEHIKAEKILIEMPDGGSEPLQNVMHDILQRLDRVEDAAKSAEFDANDALSEMRELLSTLRSI